MQLLKRSSIIHVEYFDKGEKRSGYFNDYEEEVASSGFVHLQTDIGTATVKTENAKQWVFNNLLMDFYPNDYVEVDELFLK